MDVKITFDVDGRLMITHRDVTIFYGVVSERWHLYIWGTDDEALRATRSFATLQEAITEMLNITITIY